ncbi:hypothetical protein I656_04076 [Geobacillus sp. WSUCF1]|nr:hypothetical protein I656_04076 [Geobacillus sp. WSUCF1]
MDLSQNIRVFLGEELSTVCSFSFVNIVYLEHCSIDLANCQREKAAKKIGDRQTRGNLLI